ncbi:MAG: TonB-dependent receptor [Gammaproteobacteria bacterium]|nr:TonB-dependent receptor [Gammaproteobacteria bacterium]
MNNHKVKGLLFVALASALAVSPTAIAQNGDDALIEEIMVTATKREASIYEVPIAISAFEGDKLAEQGIIEIVDIGKFVPNLNITQFSAGHISSANPFIRGIGLQDHLITTDPGVSVYVDGVYLGRQVGQNWNLTNIERIEVLRGPQGTLYGRNSIGGAINIITKTPGANEGAKVGLEVGSRGRLNGDFYADMNLSDTVALAFTGGYRSRDGLGDFLNLPNAGIEVGETKEVYGRAALRYAPSDNFSLVLAYDANDGEGGLRPYTTLIDELPNGAVYGAGYRNSDVSSDPYDNNTGQASQTIVTNKAEGFSLTADWNWNDTYSSKIIASTRTSEYKAGLDDDSFVDDFLSFPETGEADQTSLEFQFSGDMGAFDFVSGLYYFEEDGFNNQDPTVFLTFPGTFFLSQDVTSVAIYGNLGYDFTDKFRLSGGLRYTEDEKTAFTNVGSGPYDDSRDFDEITWELAANYSFDNGLTGYATVQTGYQSGQYPARPFCLFADTDPDDDDDCFKASDNITATNLEVGIKGQITDHFSMSAAIFTTEYSDLPYQVSTTSGGGFSTVNLIVDQTSTGFEWENTYFFTDNFSFQATLGYIDVDVDEQQGVKPVAPLTPELTWSISPMWAIPLASGAEVRMRLDYSYRDNMYGEPSSDPGRLTAIDSRALLNVDIAYHSPDGSFTAGLYGRNVTDERYDNARLNTGDYILQILSNDASEFGLRLVKSF